MLVAACRFFIRLNAQGTKEYTGSHHCHCIVVLIAAGLLNIINKASLLTFVMKQTNKSIDEFSNKANLWDKKRGYVRLTTLIFTILF